MSGGVKEVSAEYRSGEQVDDCPVGYKRTEVGVVPEDWDIKTIGELTSDVGDGIHSTPIYSSAGTYYFVNGNNIVNGSIKVTDDTKRVDEKEFQKHKKRLSLRTIFLSINGTIGNLAFYNNEPVVLGKSAAYMNVKDNHSLKYIFYGLQTKSTNDFFSDGLTGSTIKNLGLGVIRATPIAIPANPEEQTAIANALSDVDALITSLEKLIAKKRAIKTATMQQLLTGKKRLPPFDKTHTGYKQTELGEIPGDWEVGTIGDSAELITKGTTPMTIGRSFVQSGITFVKVESVSESGMFDRSKFAYIDNITDQLMARSKINDGDLLISIAGALGRAIIVTKEILPANTNQALAIVRFKKGAKLSALFVYHYTKSTFFTKHIEATSSQGAQPNLSLGDISNFPIVVVAEEEQRAIANILSDMDKEIATLEQRLNKTQQLKQGMMQELLTGKTRLIKTEQEAA